MKPHKSIGTPGAPEIAYRVVVLFRVVGRDGNSGGTTGAFTKASRPDVRVCGKYAFPGRGAFLFVVSLDFGQTEDDLKILRTGQGTGISYGKN